MWYNNHKAKMMRKKKMKTYLWSMALMITVTLFGVYYLARSGIITRETFDRVNPVDIVVIFGFFFATMAVNAIINYMVMRKIKPGWRYDHALGDCLMGNLGSNITPFKLAHFPMRFYYLGKKGVSFYEGLSAVTKCQIVFSVASITAYTAIFLALTLLGWQISVGERTVGLNWIVLCGLGFHVFSLAASVILAFNSKLQDLFIRITGKLKVKFKMVDDYDGYAEEQKLKMRFYREHITAMRHEMTADIGLILIYMFYMMLNGGMIYLAYLLVNGAKYSAHDQLLFFLYNLAMVYIVNILPLPGGSGSSELLFPLVFGVLIGEELVGTVYIEWRLASYFLVIVTEIIYFFTVVLARKRIWTPAVFTRSGSRTPIRGKLQVAASVDEAVTETETLPIDAGNNRVDEKNATDRSALLIHDMDSN